MKLKILYIIVLFQIILPAALLALESAPDISDREIIEKLAILETGQKSLQQALNHRISDLRSEMKAGQEALRSEMKTSHEALSKRLDDLSKRMSDFNYTMLSLFAALVVLIAALFGYIAWDRRTMVKPVIERVDRLERDVIHDLDLSSPKGSKLNRLINAMRELALTDEKVATVLRSFSLL